MSESRWWTLYDWLWWANLIALLGACLWFYPRASLAVVRTLLQIVG